MPKGYPWAQVGEEPSIGDLLSDPACCALLQADGLRVTDVLILLARVKSGIDICKFPLIAECAPQCPVCV